jgi:predicted aspartyl protease
VDTEGMRKMGTFRVGCKIVNIADPDRSAKVEKLLVDTGSDYTWLPGKVLEKLGVERVKKDISLVMANGQSITRSAGYAIIHCDRFQTVDEVIFAEPGDLLLLGERTLEGFNARVDSKQKKLVAAGPVMAAGNVKGNTTRRA